MFGNRLRSSLSKQLLSLKEQIVPGRHFCCIHSSGYEQLHNGSPSMTWTPHAFIDEPGHGMPAVLKGARQPSSMLWPSSSLLQQSILDPLQFPLQQHVMLQIQLNGSIQGSLPAEPNGSDEDALECARGNTYQPSRRKRVNKHGLGKRLSMPSQRLTLLRRMRKGRHRLTVDHYL
ncbi:hypothetical protein DUNSADRAFT_17138 [Dunaliella salina]|uniref:Uncharacterized protein n=1 Tax=Dunaliella salina TaxID=3046 RepID=A0ABQ7G2A9_DUNSA|nr:hypothetical protein DUNSADRAFT_17138 [Dunaliella salina]|eukprot:KAF5828742.1 hypothetical protein DUNSADRAFT_17138 [Dunaliella salina]